MRGDGRDVIPESTFLTETEYLERVKNIFRNLKESERKVIAKKEALEKARKDADAAKFSLPTSQIAFNEASKRISEVTQSQMNDPESIPQLLERMNQLWSEYTRLEGVIEKEATAKELLDAAKHQYKKWIDKLAQLRQMVADQELLPKVIAI